MGPFAVTPITVTVVLPEEVSPYSIRLILTIVSPARARNTHCFVHQQLHYSPNIHVLHGALPSLPPPGRSALAHSSRASRRAARFSVLPPTSLSSYYYAYVESRFTWFFSPPWFFYLFVYKHSVGRKVVVHTIEKIIATISSNGHWHSF